MTLNPRWLLALVTVLSCSRGSSGDESNTSPATATESPTSAVQTIRIDGSTTLYPAIKSGAERFANERPGSDLAVARSASGNGIKLLIAGDIEIATVAREPKPREFEAAKQARVILKTYRVAHDALAVVIHPDKYQHIKGLTAQQVRAIFFDGAIRDWSELSPQLSGRLTVYVRDQKTSGAAETFTELVTHASDTPYVAGSVALDITTEMVKSVARDPNGIAFTPLSFVDDTVRAVDFGATADRLIAATLENTRSLRYSLRRDLFLITNGAPTGRINRFIQFMMSEPGQQVIAEAGLISLYRAPRTR